MAGHSRSGVTRGERRRHPLRVTAAFRSGRYVSERMCALIDSSAQRDEAEKTQRSVSHMSIINIDANEAKGLKSCLLNHPFYDP